MSIRKKVAVPLGRYKSFQLNYEMFDNGFEVVDVSSSRPITDSRFDNMRDKSSFDSSFNGVSSFEEALDLMRYGYQPVVNKLNDAIKTATVHGVTKRTQFNNSVVGFAPIVPLAIIGVPTCMLDAKTKPMKNKVLNVYYDTGAIGSVSTRDVEEAGKKLLSLIIKLELEGYRFNLYAVKSQTSHDGCADMMVVKIKNASTPFDLKRMSFPLSHAAFFRSVGWDWYSRVPGGTWRSGYGHSLTYEFSQKELNDMFEKLFNEKCIVTGCKYILNSGDEAIEEMLRGGKA